MDMVQDFLDSAANMGAAASAIHVIKDTFVGEGAIVLEGRAGHRDACECCLIDPAGSPTDTKNRICTTKGAIGTLTNEEEFELCDPNQLRISPNGRCERSRDIRAAAKLCRELNPEDNRKFFECFIPSFSRTTSRSS